MFENLTIKIANEPLSILPDSHAPPAFVSQMTKMKNSQGDDEAFYVLNVSSVIGRYREWKQCLPRIQPFYAIKSNPDPVMIKSLGYLGVNFDCASKGEIDTVLGLGHSPDRIIYANTTKAPSYIRHAKYVGVKKMTVDNEEELKKIKQWYPDAELVLRIAVLDPTAIAQLSKKFGAEPEIQAPHLLRVAKELDLTVIGISFHVGGFSKNPHKYAQGIAEAKALFDYGKELGFDMRLLDIGGGFPGFDSPEITFARIASVINDALLQHFPNEDEVDVIAEPGRFFCMAVASLLTNVIAKSKCKASRITDNDDDTDDAFMYWINDGVFGSFNCVPVYDISPPGVAIHRLNSTNASLCRIWGPSCDNKDCIWPQVMMPEMEIGDWVAFDYMGAYTRCIASNFNNFPIPKVHYIIHESDSQFLKMAKDKSKAVDGGDTDSIDSDFGDGDSCSLSSV